MTPDEVHSVEFRKPPIGRRGYDEASVDKLVDMIEHTLRGEPHITPDELRSVTFRHPVIGRRGYREEDVDAFLQRVLEEWPKS